MTEYAHVHKGPDRFFVITGGPGSGKSTLIAALQRAGFSGADEAGGRIIRDQVSISGRALPWIDPGLFAELMLSRDMETYRTFSSQPRPVFFDRGIPDVLGYLQLRGLTVPPHMRRAAEIFRYSRRVFVAPPWPDIFTQDSERKQTLEEAEDTYRAVCGAYLDCGYELTELPRSPVEDRVRFISGLVG